MKVLAIGNSFSQDAMRYLHNIAKADRYDMKTVNLFIGGCPLSRHYVNMHNDAADYDFEYNGEKTGIKVSMRQALQSDVWDAVTLQQVSSQSIDYDTYQPYLNAICDYVRIHAPKAIIMLHQTWAYEQGSDRLTKELGYADHTEMFNDLKLAYDKASEAIGGAKIIPCGEMFQELVKAGIKHIYRDTFHASLGAGRIALGYVWYETLTGRSCIGNGFHETDEHISQEELAVIQQCAHRVSEKYRRKV